MCNVVSGIEFDREWLGRSFGAMVVWCSTETGGAAPTPRRSSALCWDRKNERGRGGRACATATRRPHEMRVVAVDDAFDQRWLIVVGGRGLDHFGRVVDYWWWAGRWGGIVCSGTNLVGPTPPQHKLSTMC